VVRRRKKGEEEEEEEEEELCFNVYIIEFSDIVV